MSEFVKQNLVLAAACVLLRQHTNSLQRDSTKRRFLGFFLDALDAKLSEAIGEPEISCVDPAVVLDKDSAKDHTVMNRDTESDSDVSFLEAFRGIRQAVRRLLAPQFDLIGQKHPFLKRAAMGVGGHSVRLSLPHGPGEKVHELRVVRSALAISEQSDAQPTGSYFLKYYQRYASDLPKATALKPKDFVGRASVRAAVKEFLCTKDRGFFLIEGPPGIGKTELLKHLVTEIPEYAADAQIYSFFPPSNQLFSVMTCLKALAGSIPRSEESKTDRGGLNLESAVDPFSELLDPVKEPGYQPRSRDSTDSAETAVEKQDIGMNQKKRSVFIIDAVDQATQSASLINSLPDDLTSGVYFILSSRSGPHLDGFRSHPTSEEPYILDPKERESRDDAIGFLSKKFPGWSPQAIRRVAREAKANFLVLSILVGLAEQGSPLTEADAYGLVKNLGAGEEDRLFAFYSRWWELLRERCIASGQTGLLENVSEFLCLLAIAYEPLHLAKVRQFLGREWTSTRFDEVSRHTEQFLEVTNDSEEPGVAGDSKRYSIYHPTFRSFVLQRQKLDVPVFHGRVVNSYRETGGALPDPTALDPYGLSYLIRHAALSESPSTASEMLTDKFCREKVRRLGSVSSLADDLSLLVSVFSFRGDFLRAFSTGFLRELLIESKRRPLLGLEAVLRIRSGKEVTGLEDVCLSRTLDDELLIHTEKALADWNSYPEKAARHLDEAVRIATDSLIDTRSPRLYPRTLSVETLEYAIERIATVDIQLTLRLALRLPGPDHWADVPKEVEFPTFGSCLFNIMRKAVVKSPDEAVSAARSIEGGFHRTYALLATATAFLGTQPELAVDLFKDAFQSIPDKDVADELSYGIVRYVLAQLPGLAVDQARKLLEGTLGFLPTFYCLPGYSEAIDLCLGVSLYPPEVDLLTKGMIGSAMTV